MPPVTLGAPCRSCHAVDGVIVCCELAAGHPLPHVTEAGPSPRGARQPRLITWHHNGGRLEAELAAATWAQAMRP